jgi:hypothetical protein
MAFSVKKVQEGIIMNPTKPLRWVLCLFLFQTLSLHAVEKLVTQQTTPFAETLTRISTIKSLMAGNFNYVKTHSVTSQKTLRLSLAWSELHSHLLKNASRPDAILLWSLLGNVITGNDIQS